jgi:hypothetical protein
LSAVWYLDEGKIELSGSLYGDAICCVTSSVGTAILSDTNGVFKARVVTGSGASQATAEIVNFSLDETDRRYIRKVFNTNPQLVSSSGTSFYASSLLKQYWLGETYEQETRDALSGTSVWRTTCWLDWNSCLE